MRVGILHLNNPCLSPYLQNYLDILRAEGIDYELVFWDRQGRDELPDVPQRRFRFTTFYNAPSFFKVRRFVLFRRFLIQTVKKQKYDRLIVLTTMTGQLVRRLLTRTYRKRYFFDIRDHTYEHIPFYKLREKRLVDRAYRTAISSEGFLSFLPPSDNYLTAHNLLAPDLERARGFQPAVWRAGQPIVLLFNGILKDFALDSHLIRKLGRDERFEIVFSGMASREGQYEAFCRQNGYTRVRFTGPYRFEEKPDLLRPAHLLFNYLVNTLIQAMSNRYYDCLVFGIPLLGNPASYCGKLAQERGLGFSIDLDREDFADALYQAYTSFDHARFQAARREELARVQAQQDLYLQQIRAFARGE